MIDQRTKSIDGETKDANLLSEAHFHPANLITEVLDVDPHSGLSSAEAHIRLERMGPNTVEQVSGNTWWQVLLAQFSSIVIWMLVIAAAIAWLTRNELEAAAILAVLLMNAAVGFVIEQQAGRALYALRKESKILARVRRDGTDLVIDSRELVPGDILILSAGERVPADARLLSSASLRTDESTLTGESEPVEKSSAPVGTSSLLAERYSMVYMATIVVAGKGIAVVTATGDRTELGRIGELMERSREEETPLERRLADLGKRLVYVVLGIAALVMFAGIVRGDDIWLMLQVAISLAVAAVPEGLPAVTTLILALGVLRMARRNAIVRRLAAVEALGSATVICTDKTGTLTENRMTVKEFVLPDGQIIEAHGEPSGNSVLERLGFVSVLCNDASFDFYNGEERAIGDPTETALLKAGSLLGLDISRLRMSHSRLYDVPFDSGTKRMIAVFREPSGDLISTMKGAPTVVLNSCSSFAKENSGTERMNDAVRTRFLELNEKMASRGFRVLGFAEKALSSSDLDGVESGPKNNLTDEYVFLGFAGMSDPPRSEVADAIKRAREAGIRIVMLTGDQLLTARAIARELDLNGGADISAYNGSDVIDASSVELAALTKTADVFSRVSPEEKLRIVEAYRRSGEIVAVTGDGVNDAPALRAADIGIAMGMRGTEVAKEASDIILADDNFATIIKAIEGGRTIYANIIKFVNLLFSTNLAEVIVIFIAIVTGLPLPLLPLQILWVNLVTDVFPAIALAVEPPTPDVMSRRPRSTDESILSRPFFTLILLQGILLATVVLGSYLWALQAYGAGSQARTVALFSLIGAEVAHLFNCRSRTRSAFAGFFRNPYIFAAVTIVVLLQIAAVTITPLATVLDLVPPTANDWVVIALSVVIPIIVVETVKLIARGRRNLARVV